MIGTIVGVLVALLVLAGVLTLNHHRNGGAAMEYRPALRPRHDNEPLGVRISDRIEKIRRRS